MIYCVEDDSAIRNMMLYTLSASGFDARGFEDGEQFFQALEQELPELVMLDVMLPGMDGMQILRQLRKETATAGIPVIMATAKGTEFDKVIGLDEGADDYMAKPFGMMEMVSRIRAVLRRTASKGMQTLVFAQLILDPVGHTVTESGRPVSLTLKEYALLRLFMENPHRAFSRDELLDKVWDTDYAGESRTVDVHVGTLRTKLGVSGNCIQTVRGVGYRFDPEELTL